MQAKGEMFKNKLHKKIPDPQGLRDVLGIPWKWRKTFQFALLSTESFDRADHHASWLRVDGYYENDEMSL